jgi:DNA-binding MarR family transcriptional regulator
MTARNTSALAKSSAVAYLLGHAEWLTRKGIFHKRPTARTVFVHLCSHPASTLPGPNRRGDWTCDVAEWKPVDIAAATGVDLSNVHRALDWLESEELICVDRGNNAPARKRKHYGPITVLSTGEESEQRRQWHHATKHPLSPAIMHQATNSRTMPLSEASTTSPRPGRTVAHGR